MNDATPGYAVPKKQLLPLEINMPTTLLSQTLTPFRTAGLSCTII
jgi:hypothetical protein